MNFKLEQIGARFMQKIKVKQNFFGQFLLFVSNIPFVNEKKFDIDSLLTFLFE